MFLASSIFSPFHPGCLTNEGLKGVKSDAVRIISLLQFKCVIYFYYFYISWGKKSLKSLNQEKQVRSIFCVYDAKTWPTWRKGKKVPFPKHELGVFWKTDKTKKSTANMNVRNQWKQKDKDHLHFNLILIFGYDFKSKETMKEIWFKKCLNYS